MRRRAVKWISAAHRQRTLTKYNPPAPRTFTRPSSWNFAGSRCSEKKERTCGVSFDVLEGCMNDLHESTTFAGRRFVVERLSTGRASTRIRSASKLLEARSVYRVELNRRYPNNTPLVNRRGHRSTWSRAACRYATWHTPRLQGH